MSDPLHDFTDAERKAVTKALKRFEQLRDEWQDGDGTGAEIAFPIMGTTEKLGFYAPDDPFPVYIDEQGYPRTHDWAQQEIWHLTLPRRIDPPAKEEEKEEE
jgi:hypothetical protein